MTYRQLIRAAVLPGAVAAVLLSGGVAAANVSVSPGEITPGSTTVLDFAVSDLRDSPTTKVEIKLPAGQTFDTMAARPKIGWDTTLVRPGGGSSGPVSAVVWTLTDDRFGIAPGAFEVFSLQLGPLPTSGPLVFPTVQTYQNSVVDNWTDAAGGAHPAPMVNPAAATPSPQPAVAPDNRGRVTAGLAIGGVLIGLAVLGSPLYGRRKVAEEELSGADVAAETRRIDV
jgi:uncharacterized protein YcnI